MPIYTYNCLTCDEKFDSIEPLNTKLSYCPICNNLSEREFSSNGGSFRLKGYGWSKHNYDSKNNIDPNLSKEYYRELKE